MTDATPAPPETRGPMTELYVWSQPNGLFIREHGDDGYVIAEMLIGQGMDENANARRIVACVNACAGLPVEQLERMVALGADFNALFDHAEDHREADADALADARAAAARLASVLRRLQEWDMNYVGPDGVHTGADTADGPWARKLIADALAEHDAAEGR